MSGKAKAKLLKAKRAEKVRKREKAAKLDRLRNKVKVNIAKLGPNPSYGLPEFVERGFYQDEPFTCVDCGVEEIWRDTQQKWWYEIAKGGVWTTARRCRSCRRKERARKAQARKVHLEGLARKRR